VSDDPLRELLRSPLDDLRPRRRPVAMPVLVFLIAAAFGAGAGLLVGRTYDEDEPAAETTTPAATTTTTAITPGEIRWEATGSFEQGGSTFVGAAVVAEPGVVPTRVEAPWTARWAVHTGGGRTVDFLEEYVWSDLPGLFTIRFPSLDLARGAELLAYPLEDESTSALEIGLEAAAFPWTGPLEQDRLTVAGAVFVIDAIRLDDGGGFIEWHLEGDPPARAWVTAEMSYVEDEAGAERAVSAHTLDEDERPERPFGAPQRSGGLEIWHLDGTVLGGDPDLEVSVTDVDLVLTVTVYHYADEAIVVELPAPRGAEPTT
jgi:hypothetical protein